MEDKICIYVFYPIEVEKSNDGLWSWKYVGCETNQVTTILSVTKNITFEELYDMVKDELEIDTTLYDFEMKVMVSNPKGKPLVLTCDKIVSRFISFYNLNEHAILICLKEKEKDIDIEVEARHVEEIYESQENCEIANDTETRETRVEMDANEETNVEDYHLNTGSDNMEVNDLFEVDDPLLLSLGDDVSLENVDVNAREPLNGGEDPLLLTLGEDVFLENVDVNASEPSNGGVPPNVVVNVERRKGCSGVVVCIPDNEDFHVNEIFNLKNLLQYKLEKLASKHKFEFKTQTSNKSIYSVLCEAEGCKWRLRATKIDIRNRFMVQKYATKHNCQPIVPRKDHRHNTYKLIGKQFSRRFIDADRINPPRDLMDDFFEASGYEISYGKANRGKHYAESLIRGDPTKSFGELPKYWHRLKLRNPGTVTHIETDENNVFKYSFMALGQSIDGYKLAMRKVISVDGTHLKSVYKGVLLVATCQDGNRQIFPLAFGVVDSENILAWTWFFEKLKAIIGDMGDTSILSDRAESIKTAFTAVFKNAHHGHCMYHMQKNMRTRYPNCNAGNLFRQAAEAYTVSEFQVHFEKLCLRCGGDVNTYLKEDLFPMWSRAHFSGLRYNIMTTNHAESVNGKLKRAREFSIVGLMEYIRATLQEWYAERNEDSKNCCTPLTPIIEKQMKQNFEVVSKYKVIPIFTDKYDVRDMDGVASYIVEMDVWKCTCKRFQLDMCPCEHAIAVVKHLSKLFYDYCTWYYGTECWRLAYSQPVYPLPNEDECEYPDEVLNDKVLPPPKPKKRGRPAKNRKASAGDSKRKVHCRKCGNNGHYITTCKRLTLE